MLGEAKFMRFTWAVLKAVASWLIPFTWATFIAFQIYTQFKAASGLQDAGLGWALITFVLMVGVGKLGLGQRLQTIYEQYFGREE